MQKIAARGGPGVTSGARAATHERTRYLQRTRRPDAWHERALLRAELLLTEPPTPDAELGALVDHATHAVAAALRALPTDRLGVPDPLADALATLLTIYVHTTHTQP